MDYKQMLQTVFDDLGEGKKMVLATCANDEVSARTMSIIIHQGKFYFQTGVTMSKVADIAVNNKVALCAKGTSIMGVCREIGRPGDAENAWFLEKFSTYFTSAALKYSHLEYERIYEVVPTKIKIWKSKGDTPGIVHLDCVKETCWLEELGI